MGHTHARRGGRAALLAGPSRQRRHGQPASTRQNKPLPVLHVVHRRTPGVPPRPQHFAPVSFASFATLMQHAAATPVAGPSLRVDIPRPPLRGLLLHALRRRPHVTATAAAVLDARWQAAQRLTQRQVAAAHVALLRTAERARASAAHLAASSSVSPFPHTTTIFTAGPSLQVDTPRPPLRGLLLRALRRRRHLTAAAATVIDAGWQAAQQRARRELAAAQTSLRRAAERARENSATVAAFSFASDSPGVAATFAAAPSLQVDVPRPPLRGLLLRALRRQRHITAVTVAFVDASWQTAARYVRQRLTAAANVVRRVADRAHAHAAHTAALVIVWLDVHIWQPAMWPFRPAQRGMLAATLASLSVAIVTTGWVVAYSTLAPAPAARAPAPPPAPKQFIERVVSPPLPVVEAPAEAPVDAKPTIELPTVEGKTIEVPLPVPPPHLGDNQPLPSYRVL